MNPRELLKTVYLGDRACRGVFIEGWKGRVSIHVDVISRIRSRSGTWDYYAAEDISDGCLVFTEVTSIRMDPSGPVPNDSINEIEVHDTMDVPSGKNVLLFLILVGSVDDTGTSTEVTIEIRATGLHLEDPARPGLEIRS
jgi:hypothetical protein